MITYSKNYYKSFLHKVKHLIIYIVSLICYFLGLDYLVRRFRQPILIILTFHRIDSNPDPLCLSISEARLKRIIKVLSKRNLIVSIDDGVELLKRRKAGIGYVFTFDDGYSDNYKLTKYSYDIPFLIYLSTGLLGHRVLWPYQLLYCVYKTKLTSINLTKFGLKEYSLNNNNEKKDLINLLNNWLKQFSPKEIDKVIQELSQVFKVNLSDLKDRMLTLNEVKEMAKKGVEFGGHTVNHAILSNLSPEEQKKEIKDCYTHLSQLFPDKKYFHFAYPNGNAKDFTDITVHLISNSNFSSAVTTIYGINNSNADFFKLRRIAVSDTSFLTPWNTFSVAKFFSETSGVLGLIKEYLNERKKE